MDVVFAFALMFVVVVEPALIGSSNDDALTVDVNVAAAAAVSVPVTERLLSETFTGNPVVTFPLLSR